MLKIVKYTFFDLVRSKNFLLIFLFFILTTWGLLYFSTSFSKAILSLMHINIFIIPLISSIFAAIYYYNARDFIEMLLAQPIHRKHIFMGLFSGLFLSLATAISVGTFIPFVIYNITFSNSLLPMGTILLNNILLVAIFVCIAINICVLTDDRIKGFGWVIISLLSFTILYDALLLILLLYLKDYPLEKLSIFLTLLNPIDLTRINILLQLDVAALMGYSGAVFNKFFGIFTGQLIVYTTMSLWIFMNVFILTKIIKKKDF